MEHKLKICWKWFYKKSTFKNNFDILCSKVCSSVKKYLHYIFKIKHFSHTVPLQPKIEAMNLTWEHRENKTNAKQIRRVCASVCLLMATWGNGHGQVRSHAMLAATLHSAWVVPSAMTDADVRGLGLVRQCFAPQSWSSNQKGSSTRVHSLTFPFRTAAGYRMMNNACNCGLVWRLGEIVKSWPAHTGCFNCAVNFVNYS